MIEIIGTALNQWDVGRSVKVTDASHVHFANQGDSKAVIMELVDSQALIPDYLLQTGKQLCVYAVANGVTIESKMFSVKNRERPENYVYEEDQRNYIYTLITDAQEATNAANQVAKDILEAKERGDFNGPKGEPGERGKPGKDGVDGKDAPQIDDTKISTSNPWSSRNIVDKLCPSFTESGSVVSCTPVEGYSLGVEWKTKNLINPVEYMAATNDEDERTTLDGDVFTTRFTSGGIHVNMRYGPCKTHPKGTYTFSFIPLTEGANAFAFVYAKSSGATIARKELLGSNPSLTFTANEEFYISLGGINGSLGTYSYKLQLEEGTVATAYEPYAETATQITRCGKNLINPVEYIKKSDDTTLDGNVFTTNFTSGGQYVNRYYGAKTHPAGTYTVSIIPVSGDVHAAIFVYDNATENTIARTSQDNQINSNLTFTASAPFRITICGPQDHTKYGTYSYKLQLEEGTTATEYEPYQGETFAIGEPIPALQGVNTIYADTGLVTVTGKADPTAIIQDLCNKVNALSATVTALTGV